MGWRESVRASRGSCRGEGRKFNNIKRFPELAMKLLAVHPSGLMYTRVFLRLEPLGLELIAGAAREAGHDVRMIDLQVENHRDLARLLRRWRPDAVCFGGNYLANVPEIVDLAKSVKTALPGCFVFV